SLVTRLLGFGLCVVGAFLAGYGDTLHSTAGIADGWILRYASVLGVAPNGSYLSEVLAQTDSYIKQNVTSVWIYYLVVGAVMAIGGIILVAAGDGKAKNAGQVAVRPSPPTR
ncbi:MAG TPA: hypothetical protein VGS04_00450, partial [Nitrososphaerales archaeon]|nr:hypothetical protein [Nitrososphaerales archaeon]